MKFKLKVKAPKALKQVALPTAAVAVGGAVVGSAAVKAIQKAKEEKEKAKALKEASKKVGIKAKIFTTTKSKEVVNTEPIQETQAEAQAPSKPVTPKKFFLAQWLDKLFGIA